MSVADRQPDVNHPAELGTVLDHLRREFGLPQLGLDGPPRRLRGGFWAEIWSFALVGTNGSELPDRVVLRLAPDADHATWETVVQRGVAAQDYPTPTVRAASPPGGQGSPGLRAWCVMDHAEGAPLLGGLSGPSAVAALPRLFASLPATLARAAARLHELDPEPIEMALTAETARTVGVDGYLEHLRATASELDDEQLRRALDHLAASQPGDGCRVVCHGDLHPFNILTDAGRLTVLDWTASQIAHPAYDIAFTHLLLSNPPLVTPAPLRPIVGAAGRRLANRFLREYRSIAPHPIDADTFAWYRRLQACRILTDLATWRTAGELAAHRGHPWLAMEARLRPLLAD